LHDTIFYFLPYSWNSAYWIERGIGRHGGKYGYGSATGMFGVLWKNRIVKYFGSLGLLFTLSIMIYYTYTHTLNLGDSHSVFSP
jgi:hypothetical protein